MIFFVRRVILKLTGVTDTELELAGTAVVLIMMYGHTIVQPQRAEVRNVQTEAQAPVVVKIAGEGIRLRADGAGIVKEGNAHANAVFLFQNGYAVFERAKPIAVAANRLVGNAGEIARVVSRVTRADVPVFETTQ